MPRLTKIYTRKGDDGSTALGTQMRVSKRSARVSAYGNIDELNSSIGFALSQGLEDQVAEIMIRVQHELLVVGAELAFPPGEKEFEIPQIEDRHIEQLERDIDALNDQMETLPNFILPGGSPGAAALQVARTVCRRAERKLVTLAESETVQPGSLRYVNRLSDLLFVIARYENDAKKGSEIVWDSHI